MFGGRCREIDFSKCALSFAYDNDMNSNDNKCVSETQYPAFRGRQISDLGDTLGLLPRDLIFRKFLSS